MNRCPLCEKEGSQNHLRYCRKNVNNIPINDLNKIYLEYNYPNIFTYENLYKVYIEDKYSLPEIMKKYGVSYNKTLFMLKAHNIPNRGIKEAAIFSSKKRELTNMEKYGAKNVLSKGTEKYLKRNKTVRDRYGVDNVFQIPEVIDKINNDEYYLKKYNMTLSEYKSSNHKRFWGSLNEMEKSLFVDMCNKKRNETFILNYNGHPSKNKESIERLKKYNQEKYKCDYFFQSKDFLENSEIQQKIKESKIRNGRIVSDEEMEPFFIYKRNCRKLTSRIKNKLFEEWNGYDYYDGEYIKENKNLNNVNPLYPTIDHKISIFYGFIKNISEIEICDIKNLCITKRSINCSKREKNYEDISKNTTL